MIPYYLNNLNIERKGQFIAWKMKSILLKIICFIPEELIYQLFIKKLVIPKDPIIILGHHRSGTTNLQKLIALDESVSTPTLFETIFTDMQVSGYFIVRPFMNFLLKFKTIEMELHKERLHMNFPGEEDVAMLSMLNPYTYNWAHIYPKQLNEITNKSIFEQSIDSYEYMKWKKDYLKFIKKHLFLNPNKRLLLKSPPSVARVDKMLDMFPSAKFIFIMRDPYTLYPSMLNFWKISEQFTFEKFPHEKFDDLILNETNKLLGAYIKQKNSIPKENLIEIKLEDLDTKIDLIKEKIGLDFVYKKKKMSNKIIEDEVKEKVDKHWKELIHYYQQL